MPRFVRTPLILILPIGILVIAACSQERAHRAHPTGTSEATAAVSPSTAVVDDMARLASPSSVADVLRLSGALEKTPGAGSTRTPNRFRLRRANGCVHDTQVEATTNGSDFTL